MLVLGLSDGQFVVRLDQGKEGVFVGRRVGRVDVGLHGARCSSTAIGEFLDELVFQQFRRRCHLDELDQELSRILRFFDPRG